ncbi:hypothetical protein D3C76_1402000 [compost metagenome]
MDRICHWRTVWKEEISRIEDPFFAQSLVRDVLRSRTQLRGLGEFLEACNLPVGRALLGDEIERASKLVGKGEWFLVRQDVRSPIDVSCYPTLNWAPSKTDCQLHENGYAEAEGPGKWNTRRIVSQRWLPLREGAY